MSKRSRRHESSRTAYTGEHRSFGYDIQCDRIDLLRGKWQFASKITRLVRYRQNQPAEDVEVPHLGEGFGEFYGVDADEAIENATRAIKGWIDQKLSSSATVNR